MDVARYITSEETLFELGIHLGMNDHIMYAIRTGNRQNMWKAAFDTLRKWRQSTYHENSVEALREALIKSNLGQVTRVLNCPTCTQNTV